MFGKGSWVCTICGQDFTRKSSGNRHNSNLHSNSAKLVRPLDYIIGRLKDRIAPPINDPLSYRRQRNDKKATEFSNGNKINSNYDKLSGYNRTSGRENHLRCDSAIQKIAHDGNISKQQQQRYQVIYRTNNNTEYAGSQSSMLSNREFKLEELKRLLSKYFNPEIARKIWFGVNGQMAIDRNESLLDSTLTLLHDIDRNRTRMVGSY